MDESSNSGKDNVRRYQKWDLLLSFFLIAVAIEQLPLRSSLWLDETLTFWIVSGSFEDVWRRAISFQGQSPLYYWMAWSVLKILPESDLAVRLFSVCCASGGLFLLYRYISLCVTLPFAFSFIVSIALLSDTFQVLFLSARPYALAFLCAMASIVSLVTWTRSQRYVLLILYALTTLLTFYAHYLFLLVGLVHITILVTSKLTRPYLTVLPLLAIGVLPGAFQLLSLRERAPLLSFAQKPTLISVLQSFCSPALLVVFIVALVLSIIWGGRFSREKIDTKILCIALFWILPPVLVFAAISTIGSTSLFTPRYWSWQIGGIALLLSVIISSLAPARSQRIAVMLLVVGMLFRLSTQTWITEGWRDAAHAVMKDSSIPVVLYSGLIEAEDPTFLLRNESSEYLSAPLRRYGVANHIQSVGFQIVESREKELPSEDFFFVSTLGRREAREAPESFIALFKDNRREVSLLSRVGTVSVYKVHKTYRP
jgi:hypothetical protein